MPDNDSRVEYRRGDRVRVQIDTDGIVASVGRLRVDVRLDDDWQTVSVSRRHLLRPPLALFDEIRVGVDPEPPVETVLVYVASGRAVRRWSDGWWYATETSGPVRWSNLVRKVARVAWLSPAARQESS